jgi:predicted metal-dependent phosphoesterase TrpH
MPVDLHVHTTASDGALTPAEVVASALALGLSTIAITDHDAVSGIDEALEAARGTGLRVVPGVELSVDAAGIADVHVLGLLIDHRHPALNATLARLRDDRRTRAESMVALLTEAGHPIDVATVLAAAGEGSVGRVHIAQALVDAGSVSSVSEAFSTLIGADAPFFVHKTALDARDAIEAMHAAGGVAVLAHPGLSGEAAIPLLVDAGLDGIEAFHAEHSPADQARFAALAASLGLLVTGGSDYHGPRIHSAPIGGGACPAGALESLEARASLYRP